MQIIKNFFNKQKPIDLNIRCSEWMHNYYNDHLDNMKMHVSFPYQKIWEYGFAPNVVCFVFTIVFAIYKQSWLALFMIFPFVWLLDIGGEICNYIQRSVKKLTQQKHINDLENILNNWFIGLVEKEILKVPLAPKPWDFAGKSMEDYAKLVATNPRTIYEDLSLDAQIQLYHTSLQQYCDNKVVTESGYKFEFEQIQPLLFQHQDIVENLQRIIKVCGIRHIRIKVPNNYYITNFFLFREMLIEVCNRIIALHPVHLISNTYKPVFCS